MSPLDFTIGACALSVKQEIAQKVMYKILTFKINFIILNIIISFSVKDG
jgi:hypothetical protein